MTDVVKTRAAGIDLLRGLVMALMCLDHARSFWHAGAGNGGDLADARNTLAFGLTRGATHLCAPAFCFLAGASAWLSAGGQASAAGSWKLLSRGLWLMLLELTLVAWGWGNPLWRWQAGTQVIFALGCSMAALAFLVWLPAPALLAVALAIALGHNAFDGVKPDTLGAWEPLWRLGKSGGRVPIAAWGEHTFALWVSYPIVPWIGCMALGYAAGPWFQAPRRGRCFLLGLALLAAFVALRFLQSYGDARGWQPELPGHRAFLSFFNATKYPPSLHYLLMTLGAAFVLLACLESFPALLRRALDAFGRVPMFFYLLHAPLLCFSRRAFKAFAPSEQVQRFDALGLPAAYLVCAVALALLYPLCLWYGRLRRRVPLLGRWL